ncbi:MAG TPA: cytochrome c biogenesis protein ResB [Burkholderiaceae bacterium]|nr:cytochrome c biogenesis protein ResB [Burkholderiaceae bacterium]
MTHRLLAHVGSLRTALVLMALLGGVVFAAPTAPWIGAALGALALNLCAALIVHPLLRRNAPLLVFHLALLAVVLLAGLGRLARLDGRFELVAGEPFDGQLIDHEAGPLYVQRLQRLAFRQDGFTIDYAPGRQRGATRNAVAWLDADGRTQRAVIGDHRPLVIDAHRVYTTSNKGFAPLLQWRPERGDALRGAVHLPSYPMHELTQSREWTLPDGRAVWVQLQFDETPIAPDAAAQFRLPAVHRLVVRVGEQRAELVAGAAMALPGGVLVYEGLRPWMGYRVTHDPSLPWLLAASLLAALSLAVHYVVKFRGARASAAPAPALAGAVDG